MSVMWSSGSWRCGPAHGFAFELEAVSVVDEAVEDRIGIGWIVDPLMPAGDRKLTGDQRRALAVAIFQELEQVVPGVAIERLQAPVVQDEQFDPGEALHPSGNTSIAFGYRQLIIEPRHASVEDRAIVAAGLVTDRACEPAFADAG